MYSISGMCTANWIISAYFSFLFLHENVTGKTLEKSIIDAAPNAEMFDAFHLMPNAEVMVMTELDLLLTIEQYRGLYSSSHKSREKRKAVRDISVRWTNCKVYYEITESLNTTDNRNVIEQAIQLWEKYSCLYFEESNTAPRRIQFKDGGGCYSQLGMQDAPQLLVLATECRTVGIIIHEIGHAIGMFHEHMRPDRDDYIRVNLDVIPEKYKTNFEKYINHVVNTYDIPYDYTSIMHYGSAALPGSIITLDPKYQDKIGQQQGMTFKDIKLANLMHTCADTMVCRPYTCPHNGFVFYKNHKDAGRCNCWCDSGSLDDPLTLCSKFDKERPGPDRTPAVIPATKECYDVREDCADLKLQNSDVCMTKMKMMIANCAKTCDFCEQGKNICMDHDKGCPLLAASGACTDVGLRQIMESLCKESCSLCKSATPCEVQNEIMGPSKPDRMKHFRSLEIKLRMVLLFAKIKM